jgi:uncharacterized repeat protein (TIGR03803 family)
VPSLVTLASFNGADGKWPWGGVVVDSAGNVYGTTFEGVAPRDGPGTVFEVARASGQVTDLATFGDGGGLHPFGGLIADGSGNLYGTTFEGGSSRDGAIFEWVHSTGSLSQLASFDGSNGQQPIGGLIMDTSGNLYGTTTYGGGSNDGTVFELARGSGVITTLASFNGTDGATPRSALVMDASRNLYGTAWAGGASGNGTIFEVAQGSGTITALASFNGTNGAGPDSALLMDGSGNLYGAAGGGGASGDGTVFELAQGSRSITALVSFNASNGPGPGNLVMDSSGNLYGTSGGGPYGAGTIFELAKGSATVTTLAAFDGHDGDGPTGLVMDGSGNLYGLTGKGGSYNDGTVFVLPGGAIPADQWTGANSAVDINWSDGANWSLGAPPTAGQRAVFTNAPDVQSFTATVDAGFTNSIAGLEMDSTWHGTITVNSPLSITGDFLMASGRFGGKGAVTIGGSLSQWTGGRIVVGRGGLTNTGTLFADTTAHSLVLSGAGTLTNDGTIYEQGNNSILLENGVTLSNAGPATFNVTGDGSVSQAHGGTFANAGTLEKTGGAGISTISSSLDNSGAITVQTGTLTLASAGGTNTGGAFTVYGGAILDLTGGAAVTYEGTYTGSGGGIVALRGGSLQVGAGGATFDISGPLFDWTAGIIDMTNGNFTNTGGLYADTTGANLVLTGAGTLTNDGTIAEAGTHSLVLENNATLDNAAGAVFDLTDDGSVTQSGGGTFTNAGTVEKTGGTGTSTIATTTLDNTGTVVVYSGILDIAAAVSQVSGKTLNAGTWIVAGTATVHAKLDITSAGRFTTLGAAAAVTLDGTTVAFPNLAGLATIDQGAVLSLLGGQSRTTVGALTNAGSLILGPGSTLTVSGSYTQTSTGTLTAEIGGSDTAPAVGQVVSTSGTVSLAGSLDVASTVVPAVGSSLTLLVNEGNSAVSGTFAGLPEGGTFTVTVGGTTMTFQISYVGPGTFGDNNVVITRTA